jgi:hypothetical protein
MGFISIVQGAALQSEYRALILGHQLAGPLRVRALTPGGLSAETVQLIQPASGTLKKELDKRKTAAFLLRAKKLRSARWYRFDLDDGGGNQTALDTYTLPDSLPANGITVAVATCFYAGFNMAGRLDATLRRPLLGQKPLLQFWGGDNLYADVPSFGLFSGNAPYEQTLDRYLRYFRQTTYMQARALTPSYTTYDDHEFWNNFPERQPHLSRSYAENAGGYTKAGKECLDLFQGGRLRSRLSQAPAAGSRPVGSGPSEDRERPLRHPVVPRTRRVSRVQAR